MRLEIVVHFCDKRVIKASCWNDVNAVSYVDIEMLLIPSYWGELAFYIKGNEMTAKKTDFERNREREGKAATYDYLDSQAETKSFVEYAKRLMRDKDAVRRLAREAGIITKTGRLTKRYRT